MGDYDDVRAVRNRGSRTATAPVAVHPPMPVATTSRASSPLAWRRSECGVFGLDYQELGLLVAGNRVNEHFGQTEPAENAFHSELAVGRIENSPRTRKACSLSRFRRIRRCSGQIRAGCSAPSARACGPAATSAPNVAKIVTSRPPGQSRYVARLLRGSQGRIEPRQATSAR